MNSERRNVIMPADWWDAIDAQRGDVSLSEWLRRVSRRALPASVRESLSEPRPAGKPPAVAEPR